MTKLSLPEALSKAQAEIKPSHKDSVNPHFKSRYASLAAVLESISPIYKYGFSIYHVLQGGKLVTTLMHESGQTLPASEFEIPEGLTPQQRGSWITYGKRYNIQALLNTASDDDDGNEAEAAAKQAQPKPVVAPPAAAKAQTPQAQPKPVVAPPPAAAKAQTPNASREATIEEKKIVIEMATKKGVEDLTEWAIGKGLLKEGQIVTEALARTINSALKGLPDKPLAPKWSPPKEE